MGLVGLHGFEIDIVGNPVFGSAAYFFVIIPKFIFIPIFEIKIYEKKILETKIVQFSNADSHKSATIILTLFSIKK